LETTYGIRRGEESEEVEQGNKLSISPGRTDNIRTQRRSREAAASPSSRGNTGRPRLVSKATRRTPALQENANLLPQANHDTQDDPLARRFCVGIARDKSTDGITQVVQEEHPFASPAGRDDDDTSVILLPSPPPSSPLRLPKKRKAPTPAGSHKLRRNMASVFDVDSVSENIDIIIITDSEN
jgi:hypothetical protein